MGPTFPWPDLDHSAPPRGVGKCHHRPGAWSPSSHPRDHASWGQQGGWSHIDAIPGVRQTGGCNMGAFYFRDNKNEIGLLRPPPGLRGKTLPSSGPSPVSSSPQDQPCSAPAPMSFHPPPLISPGPALLGPQPPCPSIPHLCVPRAQHCLPAFQLQVGGTLPLGFS